MKRLLLLLPSLAAFILVVGGVAATGAPPAGKKTTICHAAGKKYVKISVSNKALKAHMSHHNDVMPAPVTGQCPTGPPQNQFKLNGRPLTTTLTGAAEVPGPGDPNGTGTATIRLNQGRGKVCFVLTVSNITLPATGAHIHVGRAGTFGDVVVPLTPPDATGMSGGCVDASRATIKAIRKNPANYYVNVHTSDFGAGAIRGQL
jgi:CHRD domain-containing protein